MNRVRRDRDQRRTLTLDEVLDRLGDVPETYRHHRRLAAPAAALVLQGAVLKWYDVARADALAPVVLVERSRAFVRSAVEREAIPVDYGLGFVVLHHSTVLDYLIVGAWRSNQELWTSHFTRDARGDEEYQPTRPGVDASTLCVWELAPVWHEREAWVRYLESPRDLPARQTWLGDLLHGEV